MVLKNIPSDDYCEREGGWTEKQTSQLIDSSGQEAGEVKTSLRLLVLSSSARLQENWKQIWTTSLRPEPLEDQVAMMILSSHYFLLVASVVLARMEQVWFSLQS